MRVRGAALIASLSIACGSRTDLDTALDASLPRDAIADRAPDAPEAPPPDAGKDSGRDAGCVGDALVLLTETGELETFDPLTSATKVIANLQCFGAWYSLARRPDGVLFATNEVGALMEIDPRTGGCNERPVAGLTGIQLARTFALGFVGAQGAATPAFMAVWSWADGFHGMWQLQGSNAFAIGGLPSSVGRCKLVGAEDGHLFALCRQDPQHLFVELTPAAPTGVLWSVAIPLVTTYLFGAEGLLVHGADTWLFTSAQFASKSWVRRFDRATKSITDAGTVSGRVIGGAWLPACL